MVKDHLKKEYSSITEMCKQYSINPSTYRYRIASGMSVEAALTSPIKDNSCIDYLGNVFQSINQMCYFHNIDVNTYKTRIKKGMSVKDSLSSVVRTPYDKGVECVDHMGNKYRSYNEMARAYHIPPSVLRNRINRGLTLEEALQKKEVCDHEGKKYKSVREMCRAYNISINVYKARLEKGMTVKDALTIPVGDLVGGICIDHKGNKYCSVREMCKAYDIDHSTFRHRITVGMSLEEALTKNEIYDYKGNAFRSELEMCKAYHIDNSTFRYRIREGFSVEEALTIPKHYSLGEYRVSRVLDKFCEKGLISSYFHNIQIKKLFDILGLPDVYDTFMIAYDNELKDSNINISRHKLAKFRFDFSVIKEANVFAFIEYDGVQHFKFVDLFFKTLEDFIVNISRDRAKDMFAEVSGIPLLRIRYDQIEESMVTSMIADLLENPCKYLEQHNTYISNHSYMKAFEEICLDVTPDLV